MSTAPLLELRHVERSFVASRTAWGRARLRVHAVRDVSFAIPAGTTFGLVGESGSGKSTLGRLALQMLQPDSGEILFDGEPVTGQGSRRKALRREMTMIFQDPRSSLDPTWTIGRSVAEPLISRLDAASPAERDRGRLVGEALDEVGLRPEMATRYPAAFSGGQRQRISIARALITKPRLIVCDEPVSGLDVSSRAQIMTLLRDLQQSHQLTYMFISHDLSVIRALSHHVGVMYLGNLVESGPVETVTSAPAHPYTRALLAAVPDLERALTHGSRRRPPALAGDPPSPLRPPGGCPFHPRCPVAIARCATEKPQLTPLSSGHTVACHLHASPPAVAAVPPAH